MTRAPARHAVGPVAVWAVVALIAAGWGSQPLARAGPVLAALVTAAGAVTAAAAAHAGPRARRGLACLAVAAVAAGAGAVRAARIERGPLADLARRGGTATVEAIVVTEPRTHLHGWWTLVRVDRVGSEPTRARALLRGRGGAPPVLGSRWAGTASARPLEHDGFGAVLRRQYVAVQLDPSRWEPRQAPGWLAATSEAVRARIRAAARDALPPAAAGLAVGLATGDTRLLPDHHEQAMRDTGLTHLVAVSGSNVALVVVGTLAGLRLLGVGARAQPVIILGSIAWFTYLTRWEPSVLRAAAMATLVVLAGLRGRPVDPRHGLAAAVLVVVLIDPGMAAALGMLLSAAATAGVVVAGPLLRRRWAGLPRPVGELLAASVAAQLAVAPVLLASAGEVPVAAVPANLLAVPPAAVASAIAMAGSLIAAADPGLAVPVFTAARPALAMVLAVADGLRWRGGVVSWQRPAGVVATVAVAVWVLLPGRGRRLAAVVAAVAVVTLVPVVGLRAPPRTLLVTAIDVGQGDALLVEAPGARILVDGGPDVRAARWLRGAGTRDLDLVVLTHPHADHADGLPAVLDQGRVGAVWVPALDSDLPSVAGLLRRAARAAVPVVTPVAGQRTTIGPVRVEVLGPPQGRPYRAADSEPNETSLVLRITYGARVALLTGDVERAAQADLLRAPHLLRAGLLKVPHHGGATSEPAFLAAARAPLAVISVGRRNRYGHPRDEVLQVLADAGAVVRRTDRDGTLRVEVPAVGAESAAAVPPQPPRPGLTPSRRYAAAHAATGPRARPRRRRRAAAATGAGAAVGPAPRRPPRHRRRAGRRITARGPPGAADGVAVRRHPRSGGPRRGPAVGRSPRRGRGLPRGARHRFGAGPGRAEHRPPAEAAQARRGGRGADRDGPRSPPVGRARVGTVGRDGTPPPGSRSRPGSGRGDPRARRDRCSNDRVEVRAGGRGHVPERSYLARAGRGGGGGARQPGRVPRR
ncbi:MAG: ComEC/Rec2 family competence protein [Actinobacteria bacterium]|nr:ComEC/Rec2 family competence protein [Actinomycetota bacterium]